MGSTEDAKDDDWGDEEDVAKVEAVKLDIEILPDADVEGGDTEQNVMIRLKVPESTDVESELARTSSGCVARAAIDVCCVIDISASMSNYAKYEGDDGKLKHDGLEYLDIVKHAVKAVIHMLKPQDRVTLVVFDDKAEVIFELDHMTPEGKANAIAALEQQKPRDETDIWNGVLTGLEALRKPQKDGGWRQKAMLLLTDGVPNVTPPKGHIPELKAYKESHPDFSFQLNTFGFGYKLDSQLLLDLAVEGNGTFAFIPDALLVGTAFVNSLCNSLSTQTQDATLHLMPQGGAQLAGPILGVDPSMVVDASWGRVVSLGPLQFGQSREVALSMKIPKGDAPYLQALVVFPGPDGKEARSEGLGASRTGSADAKTAVCRNKAVDAGYLAVKTGMSGNMEEANRVLEAVKTEMNATFPNVDEAPATFTAVKTDVDGRITKALDGSDRFHRWGKHYLLAMTRAHQLQLCTNFMDPGLQAYGGQMFKSLRDEGDAVFLGIGRPTPRTPYTAPPVFDAASYGGRAHAKATAPPPPRSAPDPSENVYYGGGGGG